MCGHHVKRGMLWSFELVGSRPSLSASTVSLSKQWDALAFKLENGLKKLIESLQYKQLDGDWEDSFILKESNAAYGKME